MSDTPLEQLGAPYFFEPANAEPAGFAQPPNRHGQSVRTWVRSLTDMQKEALVVSAATGKAWRFASDEGWYLNGADICPCPLAFLTVGMVASYMNEVAALAEQRGITLTDAELVLDNRYTMEGSFKQGSMVAGALPPELELRGSFDCEERDRVALAYDAAGASPLDGLMRGSHTSLFTLTHNGAALDDLPVAGMDDAPLPDPGDGFPALTRGEGSTVDSTLIEKLVAAEKLKSAEGGAGSSLQDQQKRVLHLRATCTIGDDGIKQIVLEQFAPIASTWRFKSEEQEIYGGRGRAPDAASFISAGIGFCFMTQFGRYATMTKGALDAYRIVQDTHFSHGGASGKTGTAGAADAVETHVFLDTQEDDDWAREALRVGEQTCFLHALCRTDLKTKVRVAAAA